MAEQKLTPEEINEIQLIQSTQETLVSGFGELEFQIQTLELQKEKLVEQLETYKIKEKELANQLSQKYGNGTINIEEGTLTKQ